MDLNHSNAPVAQMADAAENPAGKLAHYTIIKSETPEVLTKQMSLDEDGKLMKIGGGWLAEGKAGVWDVESLSEFADGLKSLRTNEALIYGCPPQMDVDIVTKAAHEEMGKPENPIPRTDEYFTFHDGPGIMFFDYDPDGDSDPITAVELRDAIVEAVPGLAGVAMLSWCSASSHIWNAETGEEVKGAGGLRLWMMVENASDIPRVGKTIFHRLWLAGHGHIMISKSGSRLVRSIIDASVWQPSRLDFAAGALCHAPLEQRRPDPEILPGEIEFADTKSLVPSLTKAEQSEVERRIEDAKEGVAAQAEALNEEHTERRAAENLERRGIDPKLKKNRGQLEGEKAVIRKAKKGEVLSGSFPLFIMRGSRVEVHSVAEVLADPDSFDGALCCDPVEPEYNDWHVCGKIYCHDDHAGKVNSFAHGGAIYTMSSAPGVVQYNAGYIDEVLDDVVAALRQSPVHFDYGGHLAKVADGKLQVIGSGLMSAEIASVVKIMKQYQRSAALIDPPENLCKAVFEKKEQRRLKPLKAVINTPTLRPDGSLLSKPGYDAETQVYYAPNPGEQYVVLDAPGGVDCRKAVRTLLKPFQHFPFVSEHDRAVALAGVLTAVVRAALPTAPAFAFDAPEKGTGKTNLGIMTCIMTGVDNPSVSVAPKGNGKEDENRKRVMSSLMAARGYLLLDNLTGEFNSEAYSAMLTNPTYSDRKLGHTLDVEVPTNAVVVFTGNNIAFVGDILRRVLQSRIDAGVQNPAQRVFDFDPVEYVRDHRKEMVEAALTLMRGCIAAGYDRGLPALGSFEEWDRLVRRAVMWAGTLLPDAGIGDPIHNTLQAMANDSSAETVSVLVEALHGVFGEEIFTAKDVLEIVNARMFPVGEGAAKMALKEAVEAHRPLVAKRGNWTTQGLGRMLKEARDRVLGGVALRVLGKDRSKVSQFMIERRE